MTDLSEKLVLLFVVGTLLVNAPVFAIFNRATTIGELPVVYVYLFSFWLAGIAVVFVLARRRWRGEDDDD